MEKYYKVDEFAYLIDTYNRNEIAKDYLDDFVQYCNDKNYVIEGEETDMVGLYLGGKVTFWDWFNNLFSDEEQDFWYDFKTAIEKEPNYTRCLITGFVRRWDGYHMLGINLCEDLYSAVSKCVDGDYECTIYIDKNVLHVLSYGHDGNSHYEIRLVNSDTYDKLNYEPWDKDADGDFEDFLNNPDNFNTFYWNYFGLA